MKARKNRIDVYVDEKIWQWYQLVPAMKRSERISEILRSAGCTIDGAGELTKVEKLESKISELAVKIHEAESKISSNAQAGNPGVQKTVDRLIEELNPPEINRIKESLGMFSILTRISKLEKALVEQSSAVAEQEERIEK